MEVNACNRDTTRMHGRAVQRSGTTSPGCMGEQCSEAERPAQDAWASSKQGLRQAATTEL